MDPKQEKQEHAYRILTGGGDPDPIKKAELLLEDGTVESLGVDISMLREARKEALEERAVADGSKDAERALEKLLKQMRDRIARLKPFL
jgi:hypothetical protein